MGGGVADARRPPSAAHGLLTLNSQLSTSHDPNRPEDVLKVDADEEGVGGDDAADALRYLVATRARVVAQWKLRGT